MRLLQKLMIGVVGLAAIGAPAMAATSVLDFNNETQLVCGNGPPPAGAPASSRCNFNGAFIGNDYGSSAQLRVSYDVESSFGRIQFLLYNAVPDQVGYVDTAGITGFITLTPTAGQEVSFRSFGSATLTTPNVGRFTLTGGGSTIYDMTAPLGTALSIFTVNSAYFATPLVFGFVGSAPDLRLDDITFDVRAISPGVGGVPEPASWALMIGGFGLVGGAMRRRGGLASVTA